LDDIHQKDITFYHWNGLKPGGPRMCVFKLLNKGGVISKNIEPNLYKKINMEYKHLKGEIDSVI